MKRLSAALGLALSALLPSSAQINVGGIPYFIREGIHRSALPSVRAAHFDRQAADQLDAERAQQGAYPADARLLAVNAEPTNDGLWTELPNGDGVWRLRVESPGALATELYFREFELPPGAVMHVYDDEGGQVMGGFTAANNKAHGHLATAIIYGEASIIEYYEPASVRGQGWFRVEKVGHTYRRLGGDRSGDCEVDVACSEADGWTPQVDGVVRLRMVEGGQISGYCSGSLVNNLLVDCKVYFLTAHHCGPSVSADDLLDWKFYFKYQRTGCGTGSASTSKVLTGCVKRGESNDNGGSTGSDFLLVEGDDDIPASFTPYWVGWDATTTTHTGGKCIHHPAGDEKKISTYTVNATNSSQWNGMNTHYRVTWVATANGWGVTEGGSSGSPLFNSAKRVIGTLTGGSSYCESEVPGGQTQPDFYGRMNYHWTSNGGPASEDLKAWLDPNNTGTLTMDGTYAPCAGPNSINERTTLFELSVFPNPAADRVRVEWSTDVATDRIELMDMTGRLVRSLRPTTAGSSTLDLAGLASGPYAARLISEGRLAATAVVEVIGR